MIAYAALSGAVKFVFVLVVHTEESSNKSLFESHHNIVAILLEPVYALELYDLPAFIGI